MARLQEPRGAFRVRTGIRGLIQNVVKFTVNAATAPVIDLNDSKLVETVTRSSAGTFLVTLRAGYITMSAFANINGANDDAVKVASVSTTAGQATTITVNTVVGGAVADTTAARQISLLLIGGSSKIA